MLKLSKLICFGRVTVYVLRSVGRVLGIGIWVTLDICVAITVFIRSRTCVTLLTTVLPKLSNVVPPGLA
jgi:hypothetical protein